MKGSSKISKTPKKLFFLTLQSCSPEFQTSGNTDDSKNSFKCSEIVESLPGKVYNEVIWLTKRLKTFEQLLSWKRWRIIKKMSLVAFLLKTLSCAIHPPTTLPKTDSNANFSFVARIFKIAGRASVLESLFIKVKKLPHFATLLRKIWHVHGMFLKVALLEISVGPF